MASHKNPTNADILHKLEEVQATQLQQGEELRNQSKELKQQGGRLASIEKWKDGKVAVEEYVAQSKKSNGQDREKDWVKIVLAVVALAALALNLLGESLSK